MIVRIGLPKSTGALPGVVQELEAPALISAGSLWDGVRGHFRAPGAAICDLDVALDSAGFVAMSHHGGYPWSVAQYVELAGLHSWAWWAAMDFCCEKELAPNDAAVQHRVWLTAHYLAWCRKQAAAYRHAGANWLSMPMPVLQGWHPHQYAQSAALTASVLDDDWPPLVGLGSVCTRHLTGPDGVGAVVTALHRVLPAHVKLHLFGVKGNALRALRTHPRVASTDSQAWGDAARRAAHADGTSCTIERKVRSLRTWYGQQTAPRRGAPALFPER